ncbi:MAG: hypothetical protein LBT78_05915 [Tannerella sp.]|nr:hypothetical protein [Tannerella sp.]
MAINCIARKKVGERFKVVSTVNLCRRTHRVHTERRYKACPVNNRIDSGERRCNYAATLSELSCLSD